MDAALLYDGRLQNEEVTLDAVIIEMRSYISLDANGILAIPYTPKLSGRFLVHKTKIPDWENCGDFDLNSAIQSFYDAVKKHEKGAKIWNDCLDESM